MANADLAEAAQRRLLHSRIAGLERAAAGRCFEMVDDEVRDAIQRLSDFVRDSESVNLDFADVSVSMTGIGTAIIGRGEGRGRTKAVDAANRAISSLLPEGASLNRARGVIVTITGGVDLSLREVTESSSIVHAAVHQDANIIFGAVVRPGMEGEVKITVIATDLDKTPKPVNEYRRTG